MPKSRTWNTEKVRAYLAPKRITVTGQYLNANTPFACSCDVCGHAWDAHWSNVKKGRCRKCSYSIVRLTNAVPKSVVIEMLKTRQISLTSAYTKQGDAHDLRCEVCQNTWRTRLVSIKAGSGCPRCMRRRVSLVTRRSPQTVDSIMAAKNATLLCSYAGDSQVHVVRYNACGHVHQTKFEDVVRAKGCPVCANNLPLPKTAYAQYAASFGGKVVQMAGSVVRKSTWKCKMGHTFDRAFSVMKSQHSFCTVCVKWLSERICRVVFEAMFGLPFRKIRIPAKSAKGCRLELDGYCAPLKIAFEHNGGQHYRPVRFWKERTGAEAAHTAFVANDIVKNNWCRQQGILLITIKELFQVTPIANLVSIILEAVKDWPHQPVNPNVDILKLAHDVQPDESDKWQSFLGDVARIGASVSETSYLGFAHGYSLTCAHGHVFKITPLKLSRLKECSTCSDFNNAATATWDCLADTGSHAINPANKNALFARIVNTAASYGWTTLETSFVGGDHDYTFTCSRGHTFKRNTVFLVRNPRCPGCACPSNVLSRYWPEMWAVRKSEQDTAKEIVRKAYLKDRAAKRLTPETKRARATQRMRERRARRRAARALLPPTVPPKPPLSPQAEAERIRHNAKARAKYALLSPEGRRQHRLRPKNALKPHSSPPSPPAPSPASSAPGSSSTPCNAQTPPASCA